MAGKPAPTSADRKTDEAVIETFPASDPAAVTATTGNRAVPPQDLAGAPTPIPDAVVLRRRFDDAEAAKIAFESLIRQAPVDPAHAEISHADGVELRLRVARGDAPRIQKLLDQG